MSFTKTGLSEPLVRATREKGYTTPTAIQNESIPAVLSGVDLMACAQTGTGKTAGFVLPMLDMLANSAATINHKLPRALILTPTRELAAQIHESILTYGKHMQLQTAVVFGGVKIGPQIQKLRGHIEIVVATPGRLLDLVSQRAINLSSVEMLVLDEADRMLDMGFIRDIKRILELLPKKRQNLLFSATFSTEMRKFAKNLLVTPVEINVTANAVAAETVEHKIHPVDKSRKSELLSHLIRKHNWFQALVFCRTKHGANRLVKRLSNDNIGSVAIHGNKSQAQRTKALASFKQGKMQILVATDVVARGIDIEHLPQVVIFDLPNVPEDYVHRIGRTGRAGSTGEAISLVSADEIKQLKDIERVLQRAIKREEIPGFEPNEILPVNELSNSKQNHKKANRSAGSKSAPARGKFNPRRPKGARSDERRPNAKNRSHKTKRFTVENSRAAS